MKGKEREEGEKKRINRFWWEGGRGRNEVGVDGVLVEFLVVSMAVCQCLV